MKQILLFAVLALLTIPAVGQTVVTDSTIIFRTDSTYFQTRYVIRDNGESEVITTLIGSRATAQNFLFNQANDAAKDFTVCANRVLNINKDRNKIRDLTQALQTAIGVDYFALSRELNYLTFVDTIGVDKAWQWRNGTAQTPVITALNIRKLPNGGSFGSVAYQGSVARTGILISWGRDGFGFKTIRQIQSPTFTNLCPVGGSILKGVLNYGSRDWS